MSKGFLYDEGDELITRKEDAGGLPDTSEASAGDVLSLDEDKEPVWSAPSGGGGVKIYQGGLISSLDGDSLSIGDPETQQTLSFVDLKDKSDVLVNINGIVYDIMIGELDGTYMMVCRSIMDINPTGIPCYELRATPNDEDTEFPLTLLGEAEFQTT